MTLGCYNQGVGRINLLIANANQKFTKSELAVMKRAAKSAEKFISNNFDFDYEVDLIITSPSFLMGTILEDGISGRTYSSRLIILVIDKREAIISEDVIFETICHEMSHSLRWEKLPEYSKTLFDSVIMEGLAIVLEEKAMEDTGREKKQFFLKEMQNTDQAAIDRLISQLSESFDEEQYDYDTIFYTGNEGQPRWAGYRLGYYLVKEYLARTGIPLSQATLASYDSFKSPNQSV